MSKSRLIAIAFEDQNKAGEFLDEMYRLQRNELVTIEGAAVLEVDEDRKPTILRPETLAKKGLVAGAVVGGAVGTLVGAMILHPIIGGVLGGSIGSISTAASGALVEAGIDDVFVTDLATRLKPESSALFVQASSDRPYTAMLEMKPPGGTILKTTLNPWDEENLQKALAGKLDEIFD